MSRADQTVTIKTAYPPNIAQIRAAFRLTGNEIFAWGGIIYNPGGGSLPRSLIEHERVHFRQQEEFGGPEAWWSRYLADPAFRLDVEMEATIVEFQVYSDDHQEGGQDADQEGCLLKRSTPGERLRCSSTGTRAVCRAILRRLARQPLSTGELADATRLPPRYIRRYMVVLEAGGAVRRGRGWRARSGRAVVVWELTGEAWAPGSNTARVKRLLDEAYVALTSRDISAELNMGHRTARRALCRLEREAAAIRVADGPGTAWVGT